MEKYKGSEVAIVDNVKVTGNDLGNQTCQKAFIQLRIQVWVINYGWLVSNIIESALSWDQHFSKICSYNGLCLQAIFSLKL